MKHYRCPHRAKKERLAACKGQRQGKSTSNEGSTMARKRKSVSKKTGLKANGTLKKGYRYAKGGRIVKTKK